MQALDGARLEKLIDRFARVRLLVLGDVVLDEYVWGEVDRVSPEAPVPVVHVSRESLVLGGAGNVARNIVALGGRCEFCSVVGDDPTGERVAKLLVELDVDPSGLVIVGGRPTTRKTRVIARTQQVVRIDRETVEPVPRNAARRLLGAVRDFTARVDGAVLEDYGKGVLGPPLLSRAMRGFRAAELFVAVDPKTTVSRYRGASLLKPNLREAEQLSGISIRTPPDLARAAARLRRAIGGGLVVVTRGGEGMTVFDGDAPGLDVHTAAREVFDVQGAGDTTIATLALALRAGASVREAALLANVAAGVVVGKVGTATATPDEIRARLPAAIAAAGGLT